MSIFDSIFRKKQITNTQDLNKSSQTERPFEVISAALESWKNGDMAKAEKLFDKGIGAYKRVEPGGVDYALGRYGAFLLAQRRTDEAQKILEQAINHKTDIPAIWFDYLRLIVDRSDLEALKRTIEKMTASLNQRVEQELLLSHARRVQREGKLEFAEAIARWVIDLSIKESNNKGRWAAIGDLGNILENAGRLNEAIKLWNEAFNEGSTDTTTADRLSMHLERAKDYAGASTIIRVALTRGFPANVEESLRKRLLRCESKIEGRKVNKSSDIAAYSIRFGNEFMEQVFQHRLKSGVRDLELLGSFVRCLLVTKESSTIVDIDIASGTEVRRIEGLPLLDDTQFAPNCWGISLKRTAAIGKGPTLLTFLDANGQVAKEASVPDATSEIALGPNIWYVGCRNGCLYAFSLEGKSLWSWETPGSREYNDNQYFRPCPYYVVSNQSFAIIGSIGNIYAIDPTGHTRWHQALPNERQTRWEYTIPLESRFDSHNDYKILGVSVNAPHKAIKSAYRRLALLTHPDRNPLDPNTTSNFQEIQGAYEHIISGTAALGEKSGITFSIEIQGMGPMVSFLGANAESVVAGSSQGRLYLFDSKGQIRESRILGEGAVRATLNPDGSLGAAYCDNTLLFFKAGKIINAAEVSDLPYSLLMFGDQIVLRKKNHLQIMDTYGRLLWEVEFSKNITGVAIHDDILICAAGVLAAFRRRK